MKQKSIKRNYVYNLLLIFSSVIFPLVTAPYLSKVLGASGIGRVNYATAIVSWFLLGATFGIPRFAVREIARFRNDKKKISSIFWNLLFIQFVLTIIFLSIYIIAIHSIPQLNEEPLLHWIMALMLIFNTFNIDWFYQGIEEYGYITIRNIIIKCLSVLVIFLVVNNPEDYVLVAIINVFIVGINNAVNYIHSSKYVDKKAALTPFYYLKQLKIFFYISITVALYTQLDQVLLGAVDHIGLAFYVRSRSLLSIGTSFTTALITVISPRSAYLEHTNKDEYKIMVQKSINYIYLLGIPISGAIFLFARQAMYILGGYEFAQASLGLQIMAPLTVIITLGSWVLNQILIPNGLEWVSFKIQCIAAVISIILNIILIPNFSYIGATITWLIIESFSFVVKAIYAKLKCPYIEIPYFSISLAKFIFACLLMMGTLIVIGNWIENEMLELFLASIIGAGIYFLALIILKEKTVSSMLAGIKLKIVNRQKQG